MKLTFFPADKGDCFLVTGNDGKNILVDGGMGSSYRDFVAKELADLQKNKARLELVCVSHIDADHISGILQLVDDVVAWRVHDYQVKEGNKTHKPPQRDRPPEIRGIWHNAFHEQIGKNSGEVQSMLAATATILSASAGSSAQALAEMRRSLATSISEALQLSRRVSAGQLGIPLNKPFGGRLALVKPGQTSIRVGGMRVSVIGPFEEDLRNLRKEWNQWLRDHREALREIQRRAREDEELLQTTELERLLAPITAEAEELGRREMVTTPNLASLMLLVEEAGTTAVLTGDGHARDILKGLGHAGKLNGSGGLHVNLLKVQHHGSEHNIDADFCRRITADHYVFCANGAHANPDVRVVNAIIDSRLGGRRQRGPNAEAARRFTLWFNASSSLVESREQQAHLKKVEAVVRSRASPQLKVVFRAKPAGGMTVRL
jgi:beta-lactamase superfamily II metal-dependent hydrolase